MKNTNQILNKECQKVLRCIVKNMDATATKIRKKLRWAFTPTRALGFLRENKYVTVTENKGYNVSEAGTRALAGIVTAPKRRKAKVKTADPIVAAETVSEPAGDLVMA